MIWRFIKEYYRKINLDFEIPKLWLIKKIQ